MYTKVIFFVNLTRTHLVLSTAPDISPVRQMNINVDGKLLYTYKLYLSIRIYGSLVRHVYSISGSYWAAGTIHQDAIYWDVKNEIMDESVITWDPYDPDTYSPSDLFAVRVVYTAGVGNWITSSTTGNMKQVFCEL